MNCLPFLGRREMGVFYAHRPYGEARRRDEEACRRAVRFGRGPPGRLARLFCPQGHRETMAADIPRARKRGAAGHGRKAGKVHARAEGGRGLGRGRRRGDEGRRDGRAPPAPACPSRPPCSTGCRRGCRRARGPRCARTWAGAPTCRLVRAVEGRRDRPEHVQEGQPHRQRRHREVFVRIKDEFSRGRKWPDFESFEADLDGYVVHWNTRRFQVKLRGLAPEEFRSQSLA